MLIYYILLSWPTVILGGHTASITLLLLKGQPTYEHMGLGLTGLYWIKKLYSAPLLAPSAQHDHHGKGKTSQQTGWAKIPVKVRGILLGIRDPLKGKRYVKTLTIGNVSLRPVNINMCANFVSQQSTR